MFAAVLTTRGELASLKFLEQPVTAGRGRVEREHVVNYFEAPANSIVAIVFADAPPGSSTPRVLLYHIGPDGLPPAAWRGGRLTIAGYPEPARGVPLGHRVSLGADPSPGNWVTVRRFYTYSWSPSEALYWFEFFTGGLNLSDPDGVPFQMSRNIKTGIQEFYAEERRVLEDEVIMYNVDLDEYVVVMVPAEEEPFLGEDWGVLTWADDELPQVGWVAEEEESGVSPWLLLGIAGAAALYFSS